MTVLLSVQFRLSFVARAKWRLSWHLTPQIFFHAGNWARNEAVGGQKRSVGAHEESRDHDHGEGGRHLRVWFERRLEGLNGEERDHGGDHSDGEPSIPIGAHDIEGQGGEERDREEGERVPFIDAEFESHPNQRANTEEHVDHPDAELAEGEVLPDQVDLLREGEADLLEADLERLIKANGVPVAINRIGLLRSAMEGYRDQTGHDGGGKDHGRVFESFSGNGSQEDGCIDRKTDEE